MVLAVAAGSKKNDKVLANIGKTVCHLRVDVGTARCGFAAARSTAEGTIKTSVKELKTVGMKVQHKGIVNEKIEAEAASMM